MKRFRYMAAVILIAALALVLGAFSLFAADMSVKAPPNKYLTYPTGCGFYWGGASQGAAGGGSTSTISGSQVLAGDLGVLAGYTCPVGATFWFVENIASVSRVNGGDPTAGLSIAGAASFEQRLAVGAPWSVVQQLTSAFPALGGVAVPSIPPLPSNLTAGPLNPYVFVGVNERDISTYLGLNVGRSWLVAAEVGFGALTRLSNGMVVDTWVKYQPASTKMQIGGTGQNFATGDFVGFGLALKL